MTTATPADLPPPWIQCRGFRRVEELRRLLGREHAALVHGRGAPPRGTFFHAPVDGDLLVTGGALGAPLRSDGLVAADTVVAIVVVDDGAGGGHLDGVAIERDRVILLRPGAVFSGWSPAGYRWLAFHARPRLLAALAHGVGAGLRTLREAGVASAPLDAEEAAWARGALRRLGLLSPRPGREPLPVAAAAELRRHAAAILRAALERPVGRRAERGLPSAGRVARAVDRLVREGPRRLRLADLCAATGVPARTLQHTFRRWFAVRPMEYVTTVRLVAVRRALVAAAASHGTVADVARAHGFGHLGRFAAAYRRAFGESPRDTVAAAAASRPGPPSARGAAPRRRAARVR